MTRARRILLLSLLAMSVAVASAQKQLPLVLAFYATDVEPDHVDFAQQAIGFYAAGAAAGHYRFEATSDWNNLSPERLKEVSVVLWLNDAPRTAAERKAFEQYMEHGGGWIGYHAAGYNDRQSGWPWFAQFMAAVFYGNNWPPLPATIHVDDRQSLATRGLPDRFLAPPNEWYSWNPVPRANPDVKVLMTLEASNYPLGLKDVISGGDVPVVWSNRRYRMLYINMGHGGHIFESEVQNQFMRNALQQILAGR